MHCRHSFGSHPTTARVNTTWKTSEGPSEALVTHAKRPNRGKALLNANLRAPADDELLSDIADKYKPDQEIRVVQWYPGHIAKAEAALKEQLKSVVRTEMLHQRDPGPFQSLANLLARSLAPPLGYGARGSRRAHPDVHAAPVHSQMGRQQAPCDGLEST